MRLSIFPGSAVSPGRVKQAGGTHATTVHVLQPEMVSLFSEFDIAFDLYSFKPASFSFPNTPVNSPYKGETVYEEHKLTAPMVNCQEGPSSMVCGPESYKHCASPD